MERVWAIEDAIPLGALSAIKIDSTEIKIIHKIEKQIISFAEENLALVDEGEGEVVLLCIRGEQKFFPVLGLADSIDNFAVNQIGI